MEPPGSWEDRPAEQVVVPFGEQEAAVNDGGDADLIASRAPLVLQVLTTGRDDLIDLDR
jgi:hypothetical protein